MKRFVRASVFACMAGVFAAPSWGINKCTGADGKVSFQDGPCPNSAKEEVIKQRANNTANTGSAAPVAAPRVEPNLKLEGPKEAVQLLAFYRQWSDSERLLESTARIALAGPVGNLQKLQREVETYQSPACVAPAKTELVSLISANTDAMISFMQKQEVSIMAYQLVRRPALIKAFEGAVGSARCS
jgi:hypothetical protein